MVIVVLKKNSFAKGAIKKTKKVLEDTEKPNKEPKMPEKALKGQRIEQEAHTKQSRRPKKAQKEVPEKHPICPE